MPETTVNWDDQSKLFHDVLFRFEKDFGEGKNPDVANYLQGEGLAHWRLLTELLHSDLELRLRAGQDIRVQQYLIRFPELANLPNELAALVATEIRVLQQLGKDVLQRDYISEYGSVLGSRIRTIFKSAGMALPDIPGYEVLDVIGQGGMGQVYRARHLQLQRDVAIKVIRPDKVNTDLDAERYKARFRKEASSVAGVNHPHVVQIYEIGEQDGTLFLAMEYVEGNSLQKQIDSQGVLSPQAAAEMFVKIAEGVQAVHQQQIIHRDLKPDNILLTKNGEPKITDFGLARPIERDVQETQPGDVVGTPVYMSPEQASLGDEKITPLVDVYGLGATMYCALTGRAPYPRESLKVTLQKVLKEEVVPIRKLRHEVPVDLETICLKCLAKEPDQRYGSVRAFKEDLQAFLDGRPVKARPLSATARAWRWVCRHPSTAAAIIVSIASLIAIPLLVTIGVHEANLRRQAEIAKIADGLRNDLRLAHEQGDATKVVDVYRDCLSRQVEIPPENHLLYIESSLALYQTDAAKQVIQQLMSRPLPPNIRSKVELLAGTYLMGENEAESNRLIQNAITLGLSPADKYYALALLETHPLIALEHYQQAINQDSRHLQARSMSGILLVTLGRHKQAIELSQLSTVLFPVHPSAYATQFLAYSLSGNDQCAKEQLALLHNKLPVAVVQAFEDAMPYMLNWGRGLLASTNGDYAALYPEYQEFLKKNNNFTKLLKVGQLLTRFGVKNSDIKQTFAGWIPPTALTAMNSYRELFDPTKLMKYGGDAAAALQAEPQRLARLKEILKQQPEGYMGFMYAFTKQNLALDYMLKFQILDAKAPVPPEVIIQFQDNWEQAANAYYDAIRMPGHLIDTTVLSLEGAALGYGILCSPKYQGKKKPEWARRAREATLQRLQHAVPCVPTTLSYLLITAFSIEDYELAYTISLKIPDFQTNPGFRGYWATIAFHRGNYGAAFDAAKQALVHMEKGTNRRAIDETQRILQQSAEKLKSEAARVEKLQREATGQK